MDTPQILAEIEKEIERLPRAARLRRGNDAKPSKRKGKREGEGDSGSKGKRTRPPMSEESRQKIAAAQKLRWEKVRKEKKAAAQPGWKVTKTNIVVGSREDVG